MSAKPPPRPQPHPGSDYQNRGCRCDSCRASNREYQRRWVEGLHCANRYTVCDIPGCPTHVYAKGLCALHWWRARVGLDPYAPRPWERTECPYGHPYTPENTYITKRGSRQCRECDAARKREMRARARAAA